tara:strand:- start:231 stop:965 length:735 start_codon:yes stop_codon:yes gene_type:complete
MLDLNDFNENGFILKKNLFSQEEINKLNKFANASYGKEGALKKTTSTTGSASLTLWNSPPENFVGKFSTNERIVKPMENFLGEEIYHYHSKIIWKKPGDGGFDWHQDYGYWYQQGCLYSDMGSCFIMLDKATKENGCLKVLRGTHKVGRIAHDSISDTDQQADLERIALLEKRHKSVYITAEPGDALFFHCNLLHSSAANTSNYSRRTLIVCFNTKSNSPFNKEIAHATYNPLKVSSSKSIMEY